MGWRDELVKLFKRAFLVNREISLLAHLSAAIGTLLFACPISITFSAYSLCQKYCTQTPCSGVFIIMATLVISLPSFITGWMGLIWTYRDLLKGEKVRSLSSRLVFISFALGISLGIVGLMVWLLILVGVMHYDTIEC